MKSDFISRFWITIIFAAIIGVSPVYVFALDDGYITQEEARQGHPRPPLGMSPETDAANE